MTIYCHSIEEFYEAVYQLVTKGLTFEAFAYDLKITLLGGF